LAVFLAKPPSSAEVINDINGDLVNFYRCVRFHREAFLEEIEFVLHSRQEFFDFRAQPGLTDIQRASRWYFRHRECFRSVSMNTFGTSPNQPKYSKEANFETIRQLSVRLDRTTIEQLDWEKCLSVYDRAETFFYCDPPYTGGEVDIYKAWQVSDVLRFRQRLDSLKGQWLVSLNDTADIRKIFSDCNITPISRARGVQQGEYKEVLIQAKPAVS